MNNVFIGHLSQFQPLVMVTLLHIQSKGKVGEKKRKRKKRKREIFFHFSPLCLNFNTDTPNNNSLFILFRGGKLYTILFSIFVIPYYFFVSSLFWKAFSSFASWTMTKILCLYKFLFFPSFPPSFPPFILPSFPPIPISFSNSFFLFVSLLHLIGEREALIFLPFHFPSELPFFLSIFFFLFPPLLPPLTPPLPK